MFWVMLGLVLFLILGLIISAKEKVDRIEKDIDGGDRMEKILNDINNKNKKK